MNPLGIIDSAVGLASTAYNAWNQNKQLEITREREDNAVQRRAADMKKAGLHPSLAAGSPAASAPQSPAPISPPAGGIMQNALSSAQLQNIKQDTAVKRAQEDNVVSDTALKGADTTLRGSQNVTEQSRNLNLRNQTELLYEQSVGQYEQNLITKATGLSTAEAQLNLINQTIEKLGSDIGLNTAHVTNLSKQNEHIDSQIKSERSQRRLNGTAGLLNLANASASDKRAALDVTHTALNQVLTAQGLKSLSWYEFDKIAGVLMPVVGGALSVAGAGKFGAAMAGAQTTQDMQKQVDFKYGKNGKIIGRTESSWTEGSSTKTPRKWWGGRKK